MQETVLLFSLFTLLIFLSFVSKSTEAKGFWHGPHKNYRSSVLHGTTGDFFKKISCL